MRELGLVAYYSRSPNTSLFVNSYRCHAELAKHPVNDALLNIYYCSLQHLLILDSSPSAQNDCVHLE